MRVLVLLLALAFNWTAPAFADDVAAAQSVIQAQEQAFSRGDPAAAYSHAAPEIKQLFPQAGIFMQMVQQAYTPVYRHKSSNSARRARPAAGSPSASISSTTMAKPGKRCTRWSSSRDGSLKITGCSLLKAGQAVTELEEFAEELGNLVRVPTNLFVPDERN